MLPNFALILLLLSAPGLSPSTPPATSPDRIRFLASGRTKEVLITAVTAVRITYVDQGTTYNTVPDLVDIILWHGVTDAPALLSKAQAAAGQADAEFARLRPAAAAAKYEQALAAARAIRGEAAPDHQAAQRLIPAWTERLQRAREALVGRQTLQTAGQYTADADAALDSGNYLGALQSYTQARDALAKVNAVDDETRRLLERTRGRVLTNLNALSRHRDLAQAVAEAFGRPPAEMDPATLARLNEEIARLRGLLDALKASDPEGAKVFDLGRVGLERRAAAVTSLRGKYAEAQRALLEAQRLLAEIDPLVAAFKAEEAMSRTAAVALALRSIDRLEALPEQREEARRLRERAAAEVERLAPLVEKERRVGAAGRPILEAEAELLAVEALAAGGQTAEARWRAAALDARLKTMPAPPQAAAAESLRQLRDAVARKRAAVETQATTTAAEQALAQAEAAADEADTRAAQRQLDPARAAHDRAQQAVRQLADGAVPEVLRPRAERLRLRLDALARRIDALALTDAAERSMADVERRLVAAEQLIERGDLAAAAEPIRSAAEVLSGLAPSASAVPESDLAQRAQRLTTRQARLDADLEARKRAAGWIQVEPGGPLRRPSPDILWQAYERARDNGRFADADQALRRLKSQPGLSTAEPPEVTHRQVREAHAALLCQWAKALADVDQRREAADLYGRVLSEFRDTPSAGEAQAGLEEVSLPGIGRRLSLVAPAAAAGLILVGLIVVSVAYHRTRARPTPESGVEFAAGPRRRRKSSRKTLTHPRNGE